MATSNSLFITGTDTGVGKTLVCGLLLNYLTKSGIHAGYQKWISTGDAENPADLIESVKYGGRGIREEDITLQVPYRFSFPASPHLAAEIDGTEVDPDIILKAYSEMSKMHEAIIVEGVGGLMVPLRRNLLLADLLAKIQIPTIIVARPGLGTLNHTLLTIEALRRRNITIKGVLFSDSDKEDEVIARDNLQTIGEIGQVAILGRLPYSKEPDDLISHFAEIGSKLLPHFSQ